MNAANKRAMFKRLLKIHKPLILIGIHDALSAKLAQMARAQALWSSSFGFSTVSGFPDANILSFTENLDMIRKILHQTSIPLIADCDSGYGDLAIFYRVVNEFEIAGVTGICIEDNLFPKRNSFYDTNRTLAPIAQHAAKIKLAVSKRKDKNFIVIARTEAFIAGLGVDEALHRARAYALAGADAICVHSKKDHPREIFEFAKRWHSPKPLMAIPTTYWTTPPQTLYDNGYQIIIYANQLLRSTIPAMKRVLTSIHNNEKRNRVFSQNLATLQEVFDITDANELEEKELKFNP